MDPAARPVGPPPQKRSTSSRTPDNKVNLVHDHKGKVDLIHGPDKEVDLVNGHDGDKVNDEVDLHDEL